MDCFSRRTRRRARPSRSRNFRLAPGGRSTRSRPSNDSEGFRYPAGLEAPGGDGDAPDGPVGDRLHPLHVGLPDFPGPVIGVGNVVPEIGTLAADRAPRHVILRNKNHKLISRFMSGKQDQIRLGPRRKNTGVRMALVAMILLLAAGTAIPYLLARGLPPPSGSAADAILVLPGGGSPSSRTPSPGERRYLPPPCRGSTSRDGRRTPWKTPSRRNRRWPPGRT